MYIQRNTTNIQQHFHKFSNILLNLCTNRMFDLLLSNNLLNKTGNAGCCCKLSMRYLGMGNILILLGLDKIQLNTMSKMSKNYRMYSYKHIKNTNLYLIQNTQFNIVSRQSQRSTLNMVKYTEYIHQ